MLYIAFNTFNVYSFFFYLNYLNLNPHLSIFATNNHYNMPINIDTPLNRHVLNFSQNLVISSHWLMIKEIMKYSGKDLLFLSLMIQLILIFQRSTYGLTYRNGLNHQWWNKGILMMTLIIESNEEDTEINIGYTREWSNRTSLLSSKREGRTHNIPVTNREVHKDKMWAARIF